MSNFFDGINDAWATTETNDTGSSVPDGVYNCIVESGYFNLPKERHDGEGEVPAMATWYLEVVGGVHSGCKIKKSSALRKDRTGAFIKSSIAFFKQDLEALGISVPKDSNELPMVIESSVGANVVCKVETKGKYTNMYFQKPKAGAPQAAYPEVDFGNHKPVPGAPHVEPLW